MSNAFSWKTKFKSIIIVDGELFSNEYNVEISLTPHPADLKEQTQYFERLKNLYEQVFGPQTSGQFASTDLVWGNL